MTRSMTAIGQSITWVLVLCFVASIPVCAQEVQYDLIVRNTLGPELWMIPVGGPLTISEDGSKLLVACERDSTFYLVDVASGAYRPVRSAPSYWGKKHSTAWYEVDASFTTLVVTDPRALEWKHYVIDLAADTVIYAHSAGKTIVVDAISRKMDRVANRGILYSMSTLDTIAVLPGAYFERPWFDDNHNKLYAVNIYGVNEVDPNTGIIEQTWPLRSEGAYARRPRDSDWLYVFNWCNEQSGGKCGLVTAINVVTQEKVEFTRYMGGHLIAPGMYEHGVAFGVGYSSRWAIGLGAQPLWSFDAEAKRTSTILNPTFYFDGELTPKNWTVTPDFSTYLHAWQTTDPDSAITRCNRVAPLATTVETDRTTMPIAPWLVAESGWLEIRLSNGESAVGVDIHDLNGRRVQHHEHANCETSPIRIPLASLPRGSYHCTLFTSGGARTTLFFVAD